MHRDKWAFCAAVVSGIAAYIVLGLVGDAAPGWLMAMGLTVLAAAYSAALVSWFGWKRSLGLAVLWLAAYYWATHGGGYEPLVLLMLVASCIAFLFGLFINHPKTASTA